MDVKTVCLGMLTDGEASGYDLKKQFESTFAHYFAAGYGSIYPALSTLAAEGLVDCREIAQDGKPDRKVYRITESGRAHLLEALANPSPTHKVRSEFLAMITFAHLMSADQIERILANRLAEIDEYMEMFAEFEKDCMQDWPAGMQFVCGCGKAVMQAMQRYIEENGERLTASHRAPEPRTRTPSAAVG